MTRVIPTNAQNASVWEVTRTAGCAESNRISTGIVDEIVRNGDVVNLKFAE